MRGEEPVFVVTGRKEDVCAAKREILSAAEHFSQIRAQRKNNLNGGLSGPGPNSNIPGQTTIQVRVPYRVVGLVVGPKGATIKRIQQQTNTYIITPSRDKEPIFEVTGLPDNVETARKEIEAHIAMRTGGVIDSASGGGSLSPNGDLTDNGMDVFGRGNSPDNQGFHGGQSGAFSSMYSKGAMDTFGAFSARDSMIMSPRSQDIFSFNLNGSSKFDIYSFNSFNGASTFGSNTYENDEGIGDSPTFDSLVSSTASSNSVWPEFGASSQRAFPSTITGLDRRSSSLGSDGPSSSSSISSGTGHGCSSSPEAELEQHVPARRLSSDPLPPFSMPAATTASTVASFALSSSSSSSPTESLGSIGSLTGGKSNGAATTQRDCIVCFKNTIDAALVPCGHNMFCMECAQRICKTAGSTCLVCRQAAASAIRIYS